MVRIGTVWDSTTEVLARRSGPLATLATLAFFLPSAIQAAVEAFAGKSPGAAAFAALVTLLAVIASVWGQLGVVGIASDPPVSRAAAGTQAAARLPSALLLMLLLLAALIVLMLPAVLILAAAGFDFTAALAQSGSASGVKVPPAAGLALFAYMVAAGLAALFVYARLFPVLPVVYHERRGIGAIGRSWRLTRGMTWRLVGVALLLLVVLTVATWAVQAVVFVVLRLVLGPAMVVAATFAGALAGAAVSAAFSTVVGVFATRLHAALTAREAVSAGA